MVAGAGVRLLVTGHSLGGALAMLAVHELQAAFRFASAQCYTFGAPRPGRGDRRCSRTAVI